MYKQYVVTPAELLHISIPVFTACKFKCNMKRAGLVFRFCVDISTNTRKPSKTKEVKPLPGDAVSQHHNNEIVNVIVTSASSLSAWGVAWGLYEHVVVQLMS